MALKKKKSSSDQCYAAARDCAVIVDNPPYYLGLGFLQGRAANGGHSPYNGVKQLLPQEPRDSGRNEQEKGCPSESMGIYQQWIVLARSGLRETVQRGLEVNA